MKRQFTIAVIDDSAAMREILKKVISGIDHVKFVGEGENGQEAIALAQELSPDIMLMDINMSPVNGFEATRKILKQNSAIKIIGISLHKKASYARNMMKLGAKGYVTKSESHHEIVDAIQTVMKGGRYMGKNIEDGD